MNLTGIGRFLVSGLFVLAMILLISCDKKQPNPIDVELKSYFTQFEMDAEDAGISVNFEVLQVSASIEHVSADRIDFVGQCKEYSDGFKEILIDRQTWDASDEFQREFLIYHELGHCVLGRSHDDGKDELGHCTSIMHSSPNACIFNYSDMTRQIYLKELFK